MLEDDCHFLRVLFAQAVRDANAGEVRPEGNVEMVLAREPILAGVDQDLSHHALEGFLHQEIVADQVFGHQDARGRKRSGGFCCQVPPNPA